MPTELPLFLFYIDIAIPPTHTYNRNLGLSSSPSPAVARCVYIRLRLLHDCRRLVPTPGVSRRCVRPLAVDDRQDRFRRQVETTHLCLLLLDELIQQAVFGSLLPCLLAELLFQLSVLRLFLLFLLLLLVVRTALLLQRPPLCGFLFQVSNYLLGDIPELFAEGRVGEFLLAISILHIKQPISIGHGDLYVRETYG